MIKILYIIVLFIIIAIGVIFTRPEYTLLTGNKCVTCHYNHNGGGPRNVLGTYSRNEICIVDDESINSFSSGVNEATLLFDGKLQWGVDYRLQTARLGDPSNSKRELFSMQFTPYLTYIPTVWLKIGIQYNLERSFHDLFAKDPVMSKFFKTAYPGQKSFGAFVSIQPEFKYPEIRLGYIQPSIGMKGDDHTNLIRQVVTNRPSIILPPDNNEIGGELNYEGFKWASLTAGLYGSGTMANITLSDKNGKLIPIVDKSKLSYLLKAVFLPRFDDNYINTFVGSSIFLNGDYRIFNIFLGIGLTDEATLHGEFISTNKADLRKSSNYMIELRYTPLTALGLQLRYESAVTEDLINIQKYISNQIVIGASAFPLPNIELRPEFRIFDRESIPSYAQQWMLQLHIFY